ncbi:MAG: helix-hairpin-helix domain-containing protein [candidate division NC10 bacterium]|nr:helix-hairpin-helix domain-containing protein [candidate division NC10 bacterium]
MRLIEIRGGGAARAVPWANAQGVAVACLGLLLLGGTLFSRLGRSGPAFPSLGAGSGSREAATGTADAAASGAPQTTRRVAAQAAPEAASAPKPLPPGPLDINRENAAALQGLPGVGPALARQIVAYREARGPFRRLEELREVPGIGPKRYARLQGWVRVAKTP